MSKMEILGALEAEKLTKQKWEQYCGAPWTMQTFDPHPPLSKVFIISILIYMGIFHCLLARLRITYIEYIFVPCNMTTF